MPVWLQVVTSLVAAVIGGVVSPQLSQSKERRAARADVRKAIAEVDRLRWDDEPYVDFRRALIAFESAAILAGAPRASALRFVQVAEAAREASYIHPEGPDGEPVAILFDDEAAAAVRNAIDELSLKLWHPWISRLRPGSKSLPGKVVRRFQDS